VIGAIFIDSPHGLDDVIRVFKHFLSPFVLFIAKFSKVLYKEHKEEFLWTAVAKKIRPQFRFSDEPIPVVVGDSSYQVEAMMYRADVIYNQGEVMCTAYGSNKRQAERNASVMGL
jgi:dsRNA-specific ribonuclease